MESFFLAETTKYLYLLFDPDNFIHNDGSSGTIIETANGQCIIETGGYIFNTEAHPIDPSALRCCYEIPSLNPLDGYDTKKFRGDILEIMPFESNEQKENQNVTISNVDVEESRRNIVAEIINVLKEQKKEKEKIFIKERIDDSIILPVVKPSEKEHLVSEADPVEIIKLPPTRDSDDANKSAKQQKQQQPTLITKTSETMNFASYDDTNISETIQNQTNQILKSLINHDRNSDDMTATTTVGNSSVLSEFVQSILKSTLPTKPKFDPQRLLEKIRVHASYRNISQNFELLTCKAQPYLQRVSVLGEFF